MIPKQEVDLFHQAGATLGRDHCVDGIFVYVTVKTLYRGLNSSVGSVLGSLF